ncbi:MAG: glycoside hydrolase family 99-like domain-containing protein [Prevotellaceae bacterium]|jgi:hypothetical protein|nr:glycoside hydrolase family 99-like domain-containing protein [Prevotellaceae bacterium]
MKKISIKWKALPLAAATVCMSMAGFTACLWTSGCTGQPKDDYIVAAWVWPSCNDDERGKDLFWEEGPGEWEMIKKARPLYDGHYQPKQPLWGYEPDDDPGIMEKWINAASDHKVNTFIFDWYWYDGKPFLENTVRAFVRSPNTDRMNFYLMWANHHITGRLLNSYKYSVEKYPNDTLIWKGTVDWDDYKNVVSHVITHFFKQPNYLRIDGQPVFAIYRTDLLLKSFGNSWEETRKGLDYFRDEVKKAGFPGLHLQLIHDWNLEEPYLLSPRAAGGKTARELTALLGINSVTSYNMGKCSNDHVQNAAFAHTFRKKLDEALDIPVFPCVSTGYDNSPRYPNQTIKGIYSQNPESFKPLLLQAKDYADKHPEQPKIVVINAWNEWIEGSYLLPDMKYGFGYLEAVREVMSGKYDRYMK